ncbi:hypothetical protein BGW80DRAFT_1170445, partial [Lactifluus volemus]
PQEAQTKAKDKVLAVVEGKATEETKRAGADIVGGAELVESCVNSRVQATLFLSPPSVVSQRLGHVLGLRDLMLSKCRGTVTDDVLGYICRLQGTTEWKGDDASAGTIRTPIAKVNYPVKDIVRAPSGTSSPQTKTRAQNPASHFHLHCPSLVLVTWLNGATMPFPLFAQYGMYSYFHIDYVL